MSKTNATAQQLKSIIERVERLEEERRGLGADVREIYAEAKGNGFDPRSCARSSVCAGWPRRTGGSRRSCWRRICPPSAWRSERTG